MTILLTGGLGFIGRSLTNTLIHDHKLIVIDINEYKGERYIQNTNVEYFTGDVCDASFVATLCESYNFDGLIHLAAISRVVEAENNPEECLRTNIMGIKTVLKALDITNQKPWLIFGSSREVYGEVNTFPVSESNPKNPINIYGESKLEGENLFTAFAKKNNLSCAIVRFSNVYGNRFDIGDRVIPRFITAITNNIPICIEGGGQIIDFTHIDDTVHAIVKIIQYLNIQPGIEDFHILPGVGWSLYQLIEYLEEIIGKKAKVTVNHKRNYDVEKFIGDPKKSKMKLGLRDFYNLKDGLRMAVNDYLEVL